MKPSARIKEIAYSLNNNFTDKETIFAILKYLDEEYEKREESFRIMMEWEKDRIKLHQ